MKKPKFQIKMDKNNRCKVYLKKKWQRDVQELDFHGDTKVFSVKITQYVRENGRFVVENNELKTKTRTYSFLR